MSETPRRRVVFNCKIGADSIDELKHALRQIETDLCLGSRGTVVSGGVASGWLWDLDEDESITHESYFAAIDDHKAMNARADG